MNKEGMQADIPGKSLRKTHILSGQAPGSWGHWKRSRTKYNKNIYIERIYDSNFLFRRKLSPIHGTLMTSTQSERHRPADHLLLALLRTFRSCRQTLSQLPFSALVSTTAYSPLQMRGLIEETDILRASSPGTQTAVSSETKTLPTQTAISSEMKTRGGDWVLFHVKQKTPWDTGGLFHVKQETPY